MSSIDHPQWLGVSKAADRLGVSVTTVRALFDQGHLTGHRTEAGYRKVDAQVIANYTSFLRCSQAAEELKITVETVRRWFDNGDLWGYRTAAGHRRINPASIEAMRRHRTRTP